MDRLYKIIGSVVVLGLVVALILWLTGGAGRRELPPILKDLSGEVAHEFAEKLPRNRDVNDLMLLLPRRGNPRDEEIRFREELREEILKARKYNVLDWSDVKKKTDDSYLGKGMVQLGLVPGDEPKNLQEAVGIMKWLAKANQNYDGVLVVNVLEFQEGDEGLHAKVSVDGEIYGVAAGKTIEKVPAVERSVDSVMSYTYLHHRIESMSFIARFLGWFVIAAGLPFMLISLVRKVVSKRKNEWNIALIVAFTLFDVAFGWVFLTSMGIGLSYAFFCFVMLAALGYYNYDACDYIERRLT